MKKTPGYRVQPDPDTSPKQIGPGVVIGKNVHYTIEHQLGRGGFGAIFSAVSDEGLQVAIKVSRARNREFRLCRRNVLNSVLHSSASEESETGKEGVAVKSKMIEDIPALCEVDLRTEYHVLRRLEKLPGFPRPYELNIHGDETYLEMTQLGKSLAKFFEERQYAFSLATILKIMDQMLIRLESLHSKGIIHGDLKPDNILMGIGEDSRMLYLIDFGLSTMYKNLETGQHLPCRINSHISGTPRYMSIHVHSKVQQSRRDDLEALGYIMAVFTSHGNVPWRQEERAPRNQGMASKILARKEQTKAEELFLSQPREFAIFMQYAWQMDYHTQPDYAGLRKMFQRLGAILEVNYEDNF